ncbi:THO complex subunit 1-like isoform X3 [Quercus robur]|uniref:THO complex subunit 1-like isoform X3 n=1 Tax=Quercus robur TaxID=38942 RepID=UPI00216197F4|nr:THO complex subunit 1-like isoform X3 [Quercus robur]
MSNALLSLCLSAIPSVDSRLEHSLLSTINMEVFKRAILQPGPPQAFALQMVQEVIKPQKQTKLAQDENQLLENILRTLLQELVSSAVQSGEQIMQYGQLIDDGETSQGHIPRLLVFPQVFQLETNHCSCRVGPQRGKALAQEFFSKCR